MHVITSIAGVDTIKRQTRVAYGWLVVGQSVGAGLLAVRPLCLWHEQRRCSCSMQLVALYRCYMLLPKSGTIAREIKIPDVIVASRPLFIFNIKTLLLQKSI